MIINMSIKKVAYLLLPVILLASCRQTGQQDSYRLGDHLFDSGWKFMRGDLAQAELPGYNDEDWRDLTLPHDWNIEPNPIQDENHIGPFVKGIKDSTSTGNIPGGTGWYRKTFTLDRADAGNTFILYFDGVSVQSDVWINGHHLGFHPNGYTPFHYDLTPFLNPAGKQNVLAVKTVNTGDNTRWYAGAGIYRHVWLSVSKPVYIAPYGVFVTTPKVDPKQSKVALAVTVQNDTRKKADVVVKTVLYDPNGQVAGTSEFRQSCPPLGNITPTLDVTIETPQLWSPDTPALYTAQVEIFTGGKLSDTHQTKFGIRSIHFSAGKGFLLNNRETLLKGACIHHDNGLLGAATYDRAEIRRVELLKKNGFNAIRTAHNLPSAQFLDACDSIGMLVIDEAFDMWLHPKRDNDYHLYFEEWSERDVSAMTLRDRNHPSVILWSIGNEIFERAEPKGLTIAERLVATIKSLDGTRPVSQAICALWQDPSQHWDATIPVFALLDVGCYNYEWRHYERDHEMHPERVMIGTESFPREAYLNWRWAVEKTYVTGDFVWTGMDYIGEVGIGNTRYGEPGERARPVRPWPWYLSWCGDIDICGNKKPQSYYRDVVWGESDLEILVHSPIPQGKIELVSRWGWPDEYPHWNWAGNENVPLQVSVYTSYDTVRLYLDGRLIGEKAVDSSAKLTAVFTVPYQPGELTATGIKNGKEATSKSLCTTGKPAGIRLIAERESVRPDPNDLAYIQVEIIDDAGRLVPDATVTVHLTASGNGHLIAAGNASPDDLKSFRNPVCTTFRGRALAILQPSSEPGNLSLTAKPPTLPDAKIEIPILPL